MADATFELGPLVFEVEHRSPGPGGGPTLRVRDAAGERLRFDCFLEDAHWHAAPDAGDALTRIPGHLDSLDWTLSELGVDLEGYLAKAGYTGPEVPAGDARAACLAAVESALRNPPAQLDGLSVAALRQRSGEKWRTYGEEPLALWVADMDYPVAGPIQRRMARALALGEFGYPLHPAPTPLPGLFAERMRSRFGWSPDPGRVELLTDVMQGIYVAIEQLTAAGDGIVVQTPIYPPFFGALRETGRRLIENPLRPLEEGHALDVDGLRAAAGDARMLLLCNPHNPSGRVLSQTELEAIAEIAIANDLLIVSDEIHADLVYRGHRHVPIASLGPEVEARTITLASATKAFNIAGLRLAVGAFGSTELRKRFLACPRHVRGGLGALGIEATEAAWRHADPWREEVLTYLEANRDFALETLARDLPEIRPTTPQATYLLWMDCSALDLAPSPYRFFLERAQVALSDGPAFGSPGAGHARLNFATSREILADALARMTRAVRER